MTGVSRDAIPEPDASLSQVDASRSRSDKPFAGAAPAQNLVFPLPLHPERDYMMIDSERTPLSPGMTVTVEIATGSQQILGYVFSPLLETGSDALRER